MEHHFPIWQTVDQPNYNYRPLNEDIETDIAIIGGGITGITAATELIPHNKKICIIESGKIGSGTTGYSTGNLYVPTQSLFSTIAAKFGKQTIRNIINSRSHSLRYIEDNIAKYEINCNLLRRPLYVYTNDARRVKQLRNELAILQENGLEAIIANNLPIPVKFIFAIKIEHQARFNPSIYLAKLANNLADNNCQIFEQTPVTRLREEKNYCRIETTNGTIIAKQVLTTTHIPKGINKLQFFSFPYRSYAIAFSIKDSEYPNGLFWDIDSPNYSTSTHNIYTQNIDTIIVAGNHHKTGQPVLTTHDDHFLITEKYVQEHYNVDNIKATWSAQHYKTADNIPYIGLASRWSKRIYVATGYATDGLIYGTVAGLLLSDIISNKPNPWIAVYNSNRFTPLASFFQFVKENLNVFIHFSKDHIKSLFSRRLRSIRPGEGKIITIKGKKVAVYHNLDGEYKMVSAICTHMKCVVAWNEAEKSWDCPCHGSRFTVDGKIIEGPALDPLPAISY